MKMKRIIAMAMTGLFVIGTTSNAFAETGPHLLYGTEKTYGEDSTQHGELLEWEDGVNSKYAILPKNDTFSFEKGASSVDPSHNVVINWECPNSFDENGQVGLFWEAYMTAKTEKLEFGKEYPVYPNEVKTKIEEFSRGYADYTMSHVDDPFIIIQVIDYDLNYSWWWVAQVTDEWVAPTSNNNKAQHWAGNDKGWWIVNPDGSYLVDTWYQSKESGRWYYMGSDGYMLVNTITPDGYAVGADGAWVQ